MCLANLLAVSNRCRQILTKHPEYVDGLSRSFLLEDARTAAELKRELGTRLQAAPAGRSAGLVLRQFRQLEMVRIAYRDLAGLADQLEISTELSALAEACVLAGMDLIMEESAIRIPVAAIALGKLASRQMHYGSDLDLMFVYDPEPGEQAADRRAAVQQAQDAHVEALADLISAVTGEGAVYPVDLRLRAEGSADLLARTWDSFVAYACEHMQPWERLALIRSRPLDPEQGIRWQETVSRIVYDFNWNAEALREVRHIRQRIETEKNRESSTRLDFKYGKGGVADLEFLVQFLQIQHAARYPAVRGPAVVPALTGLLRAGALTPEEHDRLQAAHRFLRRVENRYQMLEERQSNEISRESPELIRLALSLGYAGESGDAARRSFLSDWDDNARLVRHLFEKYLADPR
jgi:[glutamine synthetase] adenylyltransferase / [glutamine synthetase]-adenylyl-L-tyrosine phosphorylase